MSEKKLYLKQTLILLAGVLVAWTTIVLDFINFYKVEGTIFRIQDCFVPNPVTTPCFYGGLAFVLAFIWSLRIRKFNTEKQLSHEKGLFWLLIASNIFAWTNFTLILVRFINSGGGGAGCSGRVFSSPFLTPCFYGASIFLIALIIASIIRKKQKQQISQPTQDNN